MHNEGTVVNRSEAARTGAIAAKCGTQPAIVRSRPASAAAISTGFSIVFRPARPGAATATRPLAPIWKGGMAFAGETSPLQRADSIGDDILREARRSGSDGNVDLTLHEIEQHGVSQTAPFDRDAGRLETQTRVQVGKEREREIRCSKPEYPSRGCGIE